MKKAKLMTKYEFDSKINDQPPLSLCLIFCSPKKWTSYKWNAKKRLIKRQKKTIHFLKNMFCNITFKLLLFLYFLINVFN